MYLIIDSETNGLPITKSFHQYYHYADHTKYENARIVQLSWQVLNNRFQQVCFRDYIIKRDCFEIRNSAIHGITNEISDAQGHSLNDVLEQLKQDLENCKTLVAHNLLFDYNILLHHCFRSHREDIIESLLQKQLYCTGEKSTDLLQLKMPRGRTNRYKMPKLSELYYYFFERPLENAHRAGADVDACSKCFVELQTLKNVPPRS